MWGRYHAYRVVCWLQEQEPLKLLAPRGLESLGLVFCSIHNIQAKSPVDNVIAFFEAAKGEPIGTAASS